jgi:arylsulfatase A-like enzyme
MIRGDENRPNILIVLFDCLRASDFPGGSSPVPRMPFAEELRKEATVFPRAVSPAPWTIPSHASLFTGMYPWENGVHAYHSLSTPDSVPRLPEMLRGSGYRSLSLSANPFISPRFGLVRGFDRAAWGGWWEAFLRMPRETAPNALDSDTPQTADSSDRTMEWVRDGPLGGILRSASQHSFRYPFALDAGSRVFTKIRFPESERSISQTPWIERELERWLTAQRPDEPVLCFLNLTDTHEPYYPEPGSVRNIREWWRLTRVRQDHAMAVSGEWNPTGQERKVLSELYRQSIHNLDSRLREIVRVFRKAGRWENTLMVITSDHGQSLGEHGMMFHLLRLDEPLVRIPLWIRRPNGAGGGRVARGWASLIDIVPTVLSATHSVPRPLPSSLALDRLIEEPRPAPVYSMADGIVWPHIRRRFDRDRERVWDRPLVAAYLESTKVVYSADGSETHAFDVDIDPLESQDLWPSSSPELAELVTNCKRIAGEIVAPSAGSVDATIEDRLRSWGYV